MKAEQKINDGLSGKYYFHSLYKNIGAYIRSGEIEGYSQDQFILVYKIDSNKCGYWLIINASEDDEMFGGDFNGGLLGIATEGNKNEWTGSFKILLETNPLLLDTEWEEAELKDNEGTDEDQMDEDDGWIYRATVKIFSSEDEYRNYQNGQND